MKSKFLKYTLLSIACSFGGFANAGSIVDTQDNSFIDLNTGLEWMDFGVNNSYSFNQVSGLLTTTFSEWRLASQVEVVSLWQNAFSSSASNYGEITSNHYSSVESINDASGNSAWEEIFTTMGSADANGRQLGFFQDDSGSLSYAVTKNRFDLVDSAFVFGQGLNLDSFLDSTSDNYSTMLVKTVGVPEPSTLFIFALGMLGFVSSRLKKKS